ncbi:ATP-binding protein [Prolixibacteraceae bacterium Z1-6]|uniref:histidine kinase n=1 Tax=Draconibacterium aestuarii TaxID=2998507 RepID=A0A9X3F3U5_9BACT|nr:ATP-binding protein [Prolixibacteraceae bacterium Z1-6]
MNENYTKYKRLIESLENEYFFYSHNLEGEYLYISPSVEKVLGYTIEEAFSGIVRHMTDSEQNKQTVETLKKSASGFKQKTFELELYTKNKEIKVIEITESPLFDNQGNLVTVEGVAHDITKRKRQEGVIKKQNDELQAQEQELRRNLEEMTRTKTELEQTIKDLKETHAQLVQSEKMGALGHLIAGIAHEINTPIGAINASIDNISASLDSSLKNLYELLTKLTKSELIVFLRIMELIDHTKVNLTSKEKRQFKKEIKVKLQDAGIANSFAITELLVYLNLYKKVNEVIPLLDVKDPEFILKSIKDIYSVRKNSENIKLAVDKASKIVFALKKFSHKDQGGAKEKANLTENIETVLILHHNRLKQGIEISKEYDDIPLISCYPDELVQVWTNLISNSIQAMDNKGELGIEIKYLGEKVKVSISDTGKGIPEEIRDKIFEPFFTTKKAGEGTGIGLDLVAKIIEKHNASLDLESTVGVGTTFTITLPVN